MKQNPTWVRSPASTQVSQMILPQLLAAPFDRHGGVNNCKAVRGRAGQHKPRQRTGMHAGRGLQNRERPIRQLDHLGCLLLTVQVVVDFQAVHHRSKHIDPIFGNTVTRLGVPDKCSHAKKTRPMTKGNRSFKGGAVRPQTSNTATAFHQESSRERPSAAPSWSHPSTWHPSQPRYSTGTCHPPCKLGSQSTRMRKQHALSRKVPACRKEAASNMHTQTAWYTRFIPQWPKTGIKCGILASIVPCISRVGDELFLSLVLPG